MCFIVPTEDHKRNESAVTKVTEKIKDLYVQNKPTSLDTHMFLWVMTSYTPIGYKQMCGGTDASL
jgi:hypothetical protein